MVFCKRVKFSADPKLCCFLDSDCPRNKIEAPCFQSPLKQKTCAPQYRNLSSSSCLDEIKDYCTGEKLFKFQKNWWDLWTTTVNLNEDDNFYRGNSSFIPEGYNEEDIEGQERFLEKPCKRAIMRALTKDNQFCSIDDINQIEYRRGNFDAEGLKWAQEVFNTVIDRYQNEFGSFIGKISGKGEVNDELINTFYEICSKFPILCERSLKNFCATVTPETIEIEDDSSLWCGCYMPDSAYEKYTNSYGIKRECTPFCNTDNTIPLVDADGYEKQCLADICIIDDLKLNFIRNKISGDATFRQVCGGCGGGNVKREIIGEGDFNTESNQIIGIYSDSVFEAAVCKKISPTSSNPYQKYFGENERITVTATGENENKTEIVIGLRAIPIGNGLKSEFSLYFVESKIIDPESFFTNGEKITLDYGETRIEIGCNIYAITVSYSYQEGSEKSTDTLFRYNEVVSNRCTCVIENSSVGVIDSEFRNLNLVQNCGTNICYEDGKEIPCATLDSDVNFEDYVPPLEAIERTDKLFLEKRVSVTGIALGSIALFFMVVSIIYLLVRISKSKSSR